MKPLFGSSVLGFSISMTKRVSGRGQLRCPIMRPFAGCWRNRIGAKVVQADGPSDAFGSPTEEPFDLILVNRKLDQDYSDGLEIVRQIKADAKLRSVPCMLITNHADQQQVAVAAGAEYGFGKKELLRRRNPSTSPNS